MSDEEDDVVVHFPMEKISCKSVRWWEWLLLVVSIAVPFAGGFIGAKAFNNGKYKRDEFSKPDWAPPSTVFSVVWTLVYILMGIALFLFLKSGSGVNRETLIGVVLYGIQLIANWIWGPLFFGQNNFAAAEISLCVMWSMVFCCVLNFSSVSKISGCLMMLYLIWVTFLIPLNYSVLCMNSCLTCGVNSSVVT